MSKEDAARILASWGGYSPLVHAAALALPAHLRDPEIIEACAIMEAEMVPCGCTGSTYCSNCAEASARTVAERKLRAT